MGVRRILESGCVFWFKCCVATLEVRSTDGGGYGRGVSPRPTLRFVFKLEDD